MAHLVKNGTLVLPQPTGGLICWTEGGLPGSPQPRLQIGSGEPGDTILVPDLIACDICITPCPAVPPGPMGLIPLPSSPTPTAQGGGAHVESLSPCSPLPSQEGKQEGSLYPVFTLTRFDSMLEAALLICVVGLAGCHCWVHEVLSGGPVVQAEPQA